jgi:tetratricopeptide (TPR) repeat protein
MNAIRASVAVTILIQCLSSWAATTNSPSSFDQGVINSNSRNWDKAITNLTEAILFDPTNTLAYGCRGWCYCKKGDFAKAINDFSLQIQLDPTNAVAYCNRGSVYGITHEFDKAMIDFNECLRLNPTNVIAYEGLARVHFSKGEYNQAINDWNQYLRFAPNDDLALSYRGLDYFLTSQFDKAVDDFHKSIQINSTNDEAYNNLAWLRATCPVESFRNGGEAVKDATRACELTHWKRFDWIDTLAAAYAEDKDFVSAVKYEKQAMEMNGIGDKDRKTMQRFLSLYEKQQPNHEGQKYD